MKLEMYIGLDSGEWITEYIEIPNDESEKNLDEFADDYMRENLLKYEPFHVVFWGLYSIVLDDEDDLDE